MYYLVDYLFTELICGFCNIDEMNMRSDFGIF